MQGQGLRGRSLPGSLDEARAMVTYNEWILAHSQSGQRRERAERMLANLVPVIARFERERNVERGVRRRRQTTAPIADPHAPLVRRINGVDYDVVWDGS